MVLGKTNLIFFLSLLEIFLECDFFLAFLSIVTAEWLRKESWALLPCYPSLSQANQCHLRVDIGHKELFEDSGSKGLLLSLLPVFRPLLWTVWDTGACWDTTDNLLMQGVEGSWCIHWEGAGYASFSWKRNLRKAMEEAAQATSCVQRIQ